MIDNLGSLALMEAIDKARENYPGLPINLLLGNGFTIRLGLRQFGGDDLNRDVLRRLPEDTRKRVEPFGGAYPEHALQILRVIGQYTKDAAWGASCQQMVESDYEGLRGAFIDALVSAHPKGLVDGLQGSQGFERHSHDFCPLTPWGLASVTLSSLGSLDQVFTLNFDLSLYWMACQKASESCKSGQGRPHWTRDGFGKINGVLRDIRLGDSGLSFLHGGFHLFPVADGSLEKIASDRSTEGGHNLIERSRLLIESGRFPLVVAGGTSDDKWEQIFKSRYLKACWSRLLQATGVWITFGFRFAEADNHVVDAIAWGQATALVAHDHDGSNAQRIKEVRRRIDQDRSSSGRLSMTLATYASKSMDDEWAYMRQRNSRRSQAIA